ncbi:MarR family winged helix-turn-helix transcriptional regulator [Salinispora tropica]|uniref:Transcriptional regulator, MarR family n=1 Tax=Salinispora tropica (strain ATCC BAA-916 / DSM 44818 / JCM 13857 / NBRC 105044 / CNB-440) TaxID=369723 RepID=A4X7L1_SALTO|nr:MarR family transcriptional regulator [Salinispora tropica]ABP54861.1 transcriptional regulator, MarR family [Salinispora tropica CNB-440]
MRLYVEPTGSSTAVDEPQVDDPLVDALAALCRSLVDVTVHTLDARDVDLTVSQYRILALLVSQGPVRVVDLATTLHVHPSTVTRACDRLVRRELVARRTGESDRRVSWLSLTVAGRELVSEVDRRRSAEIRRLVAVTGLAPDAELVGALEALVTAAGEPDERQWRQGWERRVDVAS